MKVSVSSSAPSEPASPQPSAAPPAPPSEPKQATWPEWFGVADLAMAVLVVIAGFGAGSYAARNSDLFYHLATGRLIAEGKSSFGVDPFSYSGEGRTWINHNWLWDLGAHLLYQKDPTGAWLVGAKAVAFALSLVVLILIRRPGAALWPWVVTAGLTVLAGAVFLQLRPFVVNSLFVALTLFVLFRLEWKAGSWRNPILMAVLFGVWANLDGCFVLGPFAVLLVLIGEFLQGRFLKGGSDVPGAFGPPPPVAGLAKALLLGVIACMANPHHVRVWQWPAELAVGMPAEGMLKDVELIQYVLEPYAEQFRDVSARGKNLNGAAYLVLFLLSALSLTFTFRTIRIAHLLLWLGFAYLSLHQWSFILPFSIVAAAIASASLNQLSAGLLLQTTAHPRTRALLLSSGIGRVFSIVFALLMVPAAWPGYLHPPSTNAANPRRVTWAVEPDEGMVNMATAIGKWRESGQLPAEVRGISPNLDFANYLAYYAPGEKVFANGRVGFHTPELPDLLTMRQTLYVNPKKIDETGRDRRYDIDLALDVMKKWKAEYLAAVSQIVRLSQDGLQTLELNPGWAVWRIGGRGIIVGPESRSALTFDPAEELFGAKVVTLPAVTLLPPPPPRESWLDDFLRRPKPSPYGTEEANAMRDYSQFLGNKAQFDHARLSFTAAALIGGTSGSRTRLVNDAELVTPILAVRAARQAIAENPDSPDPFFTLSQLYSNPFLPELYTQNQNINRPAEKQLQYVTALQRYLARVPKPEECRTRVQATQAYIAAGQLADQYRQTGQFDLARDTYGTMKAYFPYGPGLELAEMALRASGNADQAKAIKAQLDDEKKRIDEMEEFVEKRVADATDFLRSKQLKGAERFFTTARSGLPGVALKQFDDVPEGGLDQEYGQHTADVALGVVDILAGAGRLEAAASQLERLTKSVEALGNDPKSDANLIAAIKAQIVEREYRVRVLEGNYRAAGDALERANANRFAPFPPNILAASRVEVGQAAIALGPLPVIAFFQPIIVNVSGALVAEGEFAYSRALLTIFEGGRTADVKDRLLQSLTPQGQKNLPLPWGSFATRYLAMIERVNTK